MNWKQYLHKYIFCCYKVKNGNRMIKVDHIKEDTIIVGVNKEGQIIATGSIFFEYKFTHNGSVCGHIEDVVIDEAVRRKGIGLQIVNELLTIAKTKGCYKVILDCSSKNTHFYKRCGFTQKELQMRFDF
jgi:glucosamine-phosphate N-acetyltransferase